MAQSAFDDDPMLSIEGAAAYTGMSKRQLEDGRTRGNGPEYVRISARCIRYRKSALDQWLAERTFRSTSEYEVAA